MVVLGLRHEPHPGDRHGLGVGRALDRPEPFEIAVDEAGIERRPRGTPRASHSAFRKAALVFGPATTVAAERAGEAVERLLARRRRAR